MAIQILFDSANNVKSPTMVLTYRSGKSIGAILPRNLHYSESLNACNEMSFDVYKDINGIECQYWSNIKDFRLVYCVEWDEYFEIYVEVDEADETIKHIQGRSLSEAELSQIKVYGLEVNTELDISREDYKPTVIYSSDEEVSLIHKLLEKTPNFEIEHVDISIAKLQRTFTFDDKTVYDALQEVSEEVKCLIEYKSKKGYNGKIKRSISIYDLSSFCEECGHRNIDGDVCPKYSEQESAHATYKGKNINPGFGEDTSIFVSRKKLTDNITYSSDVDSVKNCFKLIAGDDLMTATVRNCSPSKSGYLWHFTQEMMSDMSSELRAIIGQYQDAYDQYNTQFKDGDITYGTGWVGVLSRYNEVCTKYKPEYTCPNKFTNYLDIMNTYYNTIDLELYLRSSMMPSVDLDDLTSTNQASTHINTILGSHTVYLQSTTNLSEYSAKNAIESYLRTVVDPKFQIKLTQSSFVNNIWNGVLTLVSYSNDEDIGIKNIAVSFSNDESGYTKQKLETSLAKTKAETPDIIELYSIGDDTIEETQKFGNFKTEIGKYGLVPLTRLRDAGQACLNILIEMGIGGDKANTLWFLNWQGENNDLYNSLYKPYYNRVTALNEEIKERQKEIDDVVGKFDTNGHLIEHGMMSYLEDIVSELQEKLDLEGYINTFGGSNATELLKELVSFRREDTYKNDNFISEGLDNAQVFSRALEFVSEADKDIRAAAVPIHTISSTLKNLLVMKEFKGIVDKFKVGNWIRAEIDSEIFKLRLIRYDIGFDDINNIQVEFSDVQSVKDSMADIQSILNQASSIAGNYSNIKIEVDNNKKAGDYVWEWVNDGLALTKMKIVDDAENQNIYWDENGFLCREYSPVMDAYEDKQLKIINKGLYLTDDNWQTTRAGIGNFIYYDPKESAARGESVYKESYGVIADTLVGNLILTKELGIYNEGNSIQMDDDGIVITINKDNNTYNQNVFKIRKETGETELDENNNTVTKYDDLFYVDSDGDLCIKGKITANSLRLGSNADVDLGFNLEEYLTKNEASNSYIDKDGYNIDKDSIWSAINGLGDDEGTQNLINKIGEFEDKAVFVAKTYGNIIEGYYYDNKFYEDIAHSKEITGVVNKYYKDKSTGSYYRYNNLSYVLQNSPPTAYTFAVSTDGLLTANNAVISGKIYASEGEFIGSMKSHLIGNNYNFQVEDGWVKAGWNGSRYNFTVSPQGVVTVYGSIHVEGDDSGGNTGGNTGGGTTGGDSGNTGGGTSGGTTDGITQAQLNTILGGYLTKLEYGSNVGYIWFGAGMGRHYEGYDYFLVDAQGALTARNAVIYGSVYANSGHFMGNLYGGYKETINNTSYFNFAADQTSIRAGYRSDGNYNFIINNNGSIAMGYNKDGGYYNLTITETGEVTVIGSFDVTSGSTGGNGGTSSGLSTADKAYLDSIKSAADSSASSASTYASNAATSASSAATSASNALTYASSAQTQYNNIVKLGETNGYVAFGIPKGTDSANQTYFCVEKDGLLTARNAVIYGTVYASSGSFTGNLTANSLTINNGAIFGGTINSQTRQFAHSSWNLDTGKFSVITTNGEFSMGGLSQHSAEYVNDYGTYLALQYAINSNTANGLAIHTYGHKSADYNPLGMYVSSSLNASDRTAVIKFMDSTNNSEYTTYIDSNRIKTSNISCESLSILVNGSTVNIVNQLNALMTRVAKLEENGSSGGTVTQYRIDIQGDSIKGYVSPSGTQYINAGESITLNAYPNYNYAFNGWYGNDNTSHDKSTWTVTPTQNTTYTASFIPKAETETHSLTVVNTTGCKQIDIYADSQCTNLVTAVRNGYYELERKYYYAKATAADGYKIVSWTETREDGTINTSYIGAGGYNEDDAFDIHPTAAKLQANFEYIGSGSGGGSSGTEEQIYAGTTKNVYVAQCTTSGNSTQLSDWTFVRFVPTKTGTYQFESVSSYTSGSDGDDTYGALYDGNKSQRLASADNGGDKTGHFRFTYDCQENTVYYLAVKYYFKNTTAGTVDLLVTYISSSGGSTTEYYTVKVESNNTNWGTVSGGGSYASDTIISIVATPNSGYRFVEWNDGHTYASRQITVTGNVTYTATFASNSGSGTDSGNTATIKVTKSGASNGDVAYINSSGTTTINPTVNTGYTVCATSPNGTINKVELYIDGSYMGDVNTSSNISADRKTFQYQGAVTNYSIGKITEYKVYFNAPSGGGSGSGTSTLSTQISCNSAAGTIQVTQDGQQLGISSSGTYNLIIGKEVELRALLNSPYTVYKWVNDDTGADLSSNNPYRYTVKADSCNNIWLIVRS